MASRSQFIEKSFLMKVAQQPQKPPNRSNHQKFLCQIEETMLIVKEKMRVKSRTEGLKPCQPRNPCIPQFFLCIQLLNKNGDTSQPNINANKFDINSNKYKYILPTT